MEYMIDKKSFVGMRKEFDVFEKSRDLLIKKSRDVLRLSKQIIYAIHRGDMKEASALVKKIEVEKKNAEKIISKSSKLDNVGAYRVAIGEYAEALLYYHYMKDKKVVTPKKLKICVDHYLLGLFDLTGELGRKAVQSAGKGDYALVVEIRDAVAIIYGELLKFDFRDSEMRRKFDSVKYDLKKLEDLVLELKLKEKI